MEQKLRELSTKRYRQWQEKERKSWTLVVAGLFLVVYFFPLASIIPGLVSSQVEFTAEALLLLLFLSLVYSYSSTSDNVRRDSTKTDLLANASPFPSGLRASGPPTPPVFHPSSGMLSPASPLGYQNVSGAGGPSRRCYPGTSPQYDSGNFRSSRGEYSWEETRRHQNIEQRTPNNYGVVSSSGGRSGSGGGNGGGVIGGGWATVSFTPPSAYQTSPKDKVSGYKKLGDGRAIEFTPALKHLGLDQLSSIFAEKLRKSLGEHVKWKIGEFDKVAREFAPYLIGEINISATPKLPSFGFSTTLAPPQPALISSDNLKRDVMDVLLLRTEYVRIDSVQMDVFALYTKANIDANTNQMGRRYKDKLQIFSKIGEGCPFTNHTKNLASVCSELRGAFGSDGYLKLSGSRRGGIGRRVGSRSATGSDDHLIMSIFFSYCDLYQDSSKHRFTAVYYWPSYNELLNGKGGVPNVGIVKNDIGEFDVFIKKEGKFLLLEIEEENENALSAIVVFLIMFHLEFNGGQFGSDERGAFDLLLTIMEATSERDLNKRFAEEFGWTINN